MADEVVAMQKNVEKAGQAISKLNDFMKENAESTKNLSKSLSKLSGGLTSIKNSGIHQAMSALSDVFTEEAGSVEALGSALAGMNLPQFVSGVSGVTTALSGAVNMAQTFTSALIGGQGIGSALVSTLGMGGTVGLAVAGTVALVGGTVILADKIHNAIDPVMQLQNALEHMSTAQEQVAASSNIIELADRYEVLRAKLADSSLSADELAAAESEMNDVRAQLSQATDGAVSTEGELNSALDSTVRIQKALAEIEAQQAKQELYDTLKDGAQSYQENLNNLKLKQQELADAEAHMNDTAQVLVVGTDAAYQALQDTLAGIHNNLDQGLINTDTLEGTEALNSALSGLEQQVYALTGKKVEFDGLSDADDRMEKLSVSTEDAVNAASDAEKEYRELSSETKQLEASTKAYEDGVISLVREGWYSAEDACDLLGISQEALQRKIKNLEFQELSAARATNDLAKEKLEAAEAAKAQADAEEKATQELGRIGVAAGQAQYSSDNLRESYNELKSQLDDLGEAGDEETRRLAEAALANLNLAATNQELADSYTLMGISVNNSLSDMSAFLINANISADEFTSGVSSMRDSVVNDFQLIATENKITADEMIANLEANLQTQQTWSNNLSELWNQAYAEQDTNVMAYINYLANMGPEYAGVVAEFADGGYYKLQEAASKWGSIGEQAVSDVAAGAWMQQYLMEEAGTELGQAFLNGAATVDMAPIGQEMTNGLTGNITAQAPAVQEAATGLAMTAHSAMATVGWADLGSAIGMGISNGFTAQTGTVQSAAGTLADAAVTAWNSHSGKFQQTGSAAANRLRTGLTQQKSSVTAAGQSLADGVTSAWAQSAAQFQAAGTAASTAIAGGISSGSGGITAAAYTAASSAYGAVSGLGWYGLGYNISAGIASGVRGGSGLITSAAKAAASAALRAAKASLDIHSPSRVFRDQVGRQIPGGIALGIEQGTPQAEKAVELSADQLLRATQIALRPSGNLAPAQSITNNTAYYGGSSGDGVLKAEAPVIIHLDGREVGRGTAKFTGQRMAYLGGLS